MGIESTQKVRIASIFSGRCSKKNICPVKDIMASYGDKWSMYAILLLGQYEKMRFNELKSQIKGISQRMLTVTLRSLEENGVVNRSVHQTIPPKVEYRLTEMGNSLLLEILSFANWAVDNVDEIIKARALYIKAID